MRKIAIMSGKGGVGKTVTAANVGVILARNGINCLVVDVNLRLPNLGLHLNIPRNSHTIQDVLSGKVGINEACVVKESGLKVLSADFESISEGIKLIKTHPLHKLGNILSKANSEIILMDSPPASNFLAEPVLAACDEIVIVTTPYLTSIDATLNLIKSAKQHEKKITGLIINRVKGEPFEMDPREISNLCNLNLLGIIPEDNLIPESITMRTPVVQYSAFSKPSMEFEEVALLIAGKHIPNHRQTLRYHVSNILRQIIG